MLKSAHVSKTVLTMTVSGCLYLLSTTSGFAGFEWVPQERAASPQVSQPQQEVPMQVMEAPVAHVTGEPLQAPAQVLQVPADHQTGQIIQQIPAPAQVAAQPAPVIQQIPAPEMTEPSVMMPSPFDAPTPVAVQPVAPTPAPAVVAAPQRQAVIPAPIAEAETLAPEAPRQPLHVPPPVTQAAQAPSVPAQVEAFEQKQADVAREAESLMQSMTAPASVSAPAPQSAAIAAPAVVIPAPLQPADTVPSAQQAQTVIPALNVETPAKPAVASADYTAQALAQIAETLEVAAEKTAAVIAAPSVPVIQNTVNADAVVIPAQEPVVIDQQPAQGNLSVAEQAAQKAEAAKKMLADRANQQTAAAQPLAQQTTDVLAPVAVSAVEANDPVAVNEMLARPEADPLVEAQENVVIPAVDTAIVNEQNPNIALEAALAPPAPEARAVSSEEAQAVETATTNEAPLAPVSSPVTADAGAYAVVYGFGEDMPLALALQQIVPEGYAYSFAKSVNPGARIDWEGDRAWNVVLDEALGKAGLKAQISGNAVLVMQASDRFTSSGASITKEHPEAKTFDVMWDLEPAAGTEAPATPAPADALIAPLEPVSLGTTDGASQANVKRTIKDPGENPSQQPSMTGATAEIPQQQVSSLIPETNAVIEDDMVQDLAATELAAPAQEKKSKSGVWTAEKGQSLKKVLYGWSQKGNVQIVWEASHDYIVENDVRVEGTLDEAMVNLFKVSMAQDNYPSVRIIESQKNSGTTAMVIVQDPAASGKQAQKSATPVELEASEG